MQIEHVAQLAGRFSSRILLEHQTRTINGKSMLGLLSLGDTGEDPVTLIADGEDEEAAAREMKELLITGVAPPKGVRDAEALMQRIKKRYVEILKDQLVGIYLHGSLAAGCFHWEHSDIDFLVVTHGEIRVEAKIGLVETLYALLPEAPPEGFEMSVVQEKYCRNIPYPMPYELHFSSGHIRAYERDPRGYCQRMHGTDPDLTAHIMCLNAFGAVVHGPGIPRVFDQVSRQDALAAIRYDVQDAEEHLHENPCYFVLNLCRALAYFRENRVLSKKEGGEWALTHLDHEHQRVIQAALNAYESGRDMFYDRGQAEDFCYDALEELKEA